MKKNLIATLLVAVGVAGLMSCNDDSTTTGNNDTLTTDNTVNSTTSTSDYSAMADSFQRNSEAGKYMDVRTGKQIKISVDRTTGAKVNTATNEPVTRYIYVMDSDWWVYDAEGNQLGKAKWENDKVLFDDNGKWVEYDVKWKTDEDGTKMKSGDTKIKTDEDGSKLKTNDKKVKTDEDGTKTKDN